MQRQVARRPLPWAELPIVLPASGLARADADRWFRRKRIAPRIYSEVAGSEAILSLVSLGCGVGIVPRIVMDKSPLRAEVRALDVEPEIGEFRVGVCTQRRKLQSPLVRAFWDSIGGRFGQLEGADQLDRRRRSGRPAAFWSGDAAVDAVPGDVEVAEHRDDEAVVDADAIGQRTLNHRDQRAADDRHAQDPRALAGVLAEAVDRDGEDRREHDRVEEPDRDAPTTSRPGRWRAS